MMRGDENVELITGYVRGGQCMLIFLIAKFSLGTLKCCRREMDNMIYESLGQSSTDDVGRV